MSTSTPTPGAVTTPRAPDPHRLWDQVGLAATTIRALARDGAGSLTRLHRSPVRLALVALWVFGIVGDAFTTHQMMSSGLYEEANPIAAAIMSVTGMPGWVAVASLACTGLAVLSLGRPRNLYGYVIVVGLVGVALLKAYAAASNIALWNGV